MSNDYKKIFLVNDLTISGGLERVVTNLANIFSEKGETVEIISLHKEKKELFYKINPEVKITFFSNSRQNKNRKIRGVLKFFKYVKLYVRLFRTKKIVIIGTDYYLNSLISILPRDTFYKKIGCEHINYEAVSNFWKKIRLVFYKKLDKVIVVNNSDKKMFEKNLTNVKCIYNPVVYRESENSELINKKIMAVGRLSEEKDFLEMVEIAKEIFQEFPEWILNIFGEGELLKEIQFKVKEYGLEKNVFLKGVVKNLEEEYSTSSILISTSKRESFSLAIAEAQFFGVPVVAYNCPVGPEELIENRRNGILIPPGDRKKFVYELKELIKNEKNRKKLGLNSKENNKKFSKENIYKEWKKILNEV